MYAGPRPKPLPASALRSEDSAVEAEFRRQMDLAQMEGAQLAAEEDRVEFLAVGGRPEDRLERAWTRMEDERDPSETYHDRYGSSGPDGAW